METDILVTPQADETALLRVLLEGQTSEWVNLPVDAAPLHAVFERLGIHCCDDLHVADVSSPHKSISAALAGETDLDGLNMLATFLAGMEDYELEKVCAIVQLGLGKYGNGALDALLNILGDQDNFDGFNLLPANDATELGRYWSLEENHGIQSAAGLAAYGHENMVDGGIFTEWGYIYERWQPTRLHDGKSLPAEYRLVDAALQFGATQIDKTAVFVVDEKQNARRPSLHDALKRKDKQAKTQHPTDAKDRPKAQER